MRINQPSTNLDKDLSYKHNPMNLISHTFYLTYAYLKLGSQVKIDDYLVKIIRYGK